MKPLLHKSKTGIAGFDQITFGGLPKGRTTLVCGGAGCGKSLFGMQYLVNGIREFNEAGLFVAFEENAQELKENYSSLGYNLDRHIKNKKLFIDYVHFDKSDIEAGDYNLDALFIRIEAAINKIQAKRVVLDTIETLFAGYSERTLRSELRRLFRFLKDKGVTTILTGEKGEHTLTRHGLEEFVSDCVVFLDHRITEQLSTRRLHVIKYRGSVHGTNEYPFLIDEKGISVLPITSVGLNYHVKSERISTGINKLDVMFSGKGYYKGSTILVSGSAGTGKTSIASSFVEAACKRGEKCMYLAFEESSDQIIRNMSSIGIDFKPFVKKKSLNFHTVRPTLYGLEMHLVMINKSLEEFKPDVVVLDPISNLISQGNSFEVKGMLLRLIDSLKLQNVTTLMTNLTSKNVDFEHVEINVSSIADTWIVMRDTEINGELKRGIFIVKSRGMNHSNKVREFIISDKGIDLQDIPLPVNNLLQHNENI